MNLHDLGLSVGVIIALLVVIAINTFLIMIIWNQVLINKFPNSNIQKLNFWDALAISVLCSILFGRSTIIWQDVKNI